MRPRKAIGHLLRKLLARQGYSLTRGGQLHRDTMAGAIQAMKRRRQSFRTVIDVGASDGRWSSLMMEHFPACEYLLLEAQPVHEKALTEFCASHSNAQYVMKAAAATSGRIHFKANRPFGGQASLKPFKKDTITVPATTVDVEVQLRQLKEPFLLKLDTHGFEAPILDGAQQVLTHTEVIVIECYNFKISQESLLFYEMCCKIAPLGFRCIDLVDLRHRPYDGSFWQMDLVFIRSDRPEFRYSEFR